MDVYHGGVMTEKKGGPPDAHAPPRRAGAPPANGRTNAPTHLLHALDDRTLLCLIMSELETRRDNNNTSAHNNNTNNTSNTNEKKQHKRSKVNGKVNHNTAGT